MVHNIHSNTTCTSNERRTASRENRRKKRNWLHNEINNICGHDKWFPIDNVNDPMSRYYASFRFAGLLLSLSVRSERVSIPFSNLLNSQLHLVWITTCHLHSLFDSFSLSLTSSFSSSNPLPLGEREGCGLFSPIPFLLHMIRHLKIYV